jgi:hypothetical protein
MTEHMPPDDRELEQYLKGGSKLSRRYRDASSESAPPELDEAILAQARAELRRKPAGINRWLAPVALAASLVLGVNLAWNVYQAQPVPGGAPVLADKASRDDGFVPPPPPAAEPPVEPRANAPAAPAKPTAKLESKSRFVQEPASASPEEAYEGAPSASGGLAQREADLGTREKEQQALRKAQAEDRAAMAQRPEGSEAGAAQAPAAAAPRAADFPLPTEAQKIERLIAYVAGLEDAVFIRNGTAHTPQEAARQLRRKLEEAGDRVQTADDFIRLCVSHSSVPGEAYLVRYSDGRTRTAEDVLRDDLLQMQAAP